MYAVVASENPLAQAGKQLIIPARANPSPAPWLALSRPSSTRALSRSVCRRSNQPGTGIGKSLVVEIDRLRCQDYAQSISPRLLQQSEHRLL